jgi:hypothetical protein
MGNLSPIKKDSLDEICEVVNSDSRAMQNQQMVRLEQAKRSGGIAMGPL